MRRAYVHNTYLTVIVTCIYCLFIHIHGGKQRLTPQIIQGVLLETRFMRREVLKSFRIGQPNIFS